ncbi:MAG: hypothetical protein H6605_07345 [Flavobacteriales bacterium]|nr:hypothetical protein [Flavobacteriales bacterium]
MARADLLFLKNFKKSKATVFGFGLKSVILISKVFNLAFAGILLFSACNSEQGGKVSVEPDKITFTEHIAPIIYKNCVFCHRPEGIAPFSLVTYRNVYRKKKTIAEVVSKGIMPPWPADPSYSHFVGERILTEDEKLLIKYWAQNGAKKGPEEAMPELPTFPEGSFLGKPDLTLWLDSVVLDAHSLDRFLTIKIPFEIPKDTFVRAVEFVPGKDNLVHHMNGHLLNYKEQDKKNVFDGSRIADLQSPKYSEEFQLLKMYNDDGTEPERVHSAVNYLPGVYPTLYPEGLGGFRLSKIGAFVANDIHYGPSHKNSVDRSHINVFYSRKPPDRPTFELMLGTNGQTEIVPPLVVPPNRVVTCRTKGVVPEDISVLTINPHMHLLGTSFKAFGLTVTGDTIPLIRIKRWDFNWQYFYTFKNPVKLPKGTMIIVEGVFDNTANNPFNPFDPPRTISDKNRTMKTSDEMFQFIITWVPYQKGDENINMETFLEQVTPTTSEQ